MTHTQYANWTSAESEILETGHAWAKGHAGIWETLMVYEKDSAPAWAGPVKADHEVVMSMRRQRAGMLPLSYLVFEEAVEELRL